MRTPQSILVIILAFSLISCQTPPPRSPVGSQAAPSKSSFTGPIGEYVQVAPEPPREVVQSLSTESKDKQDGKKKVVSIPGSSMKAGLLSPSGQETITPASPGPDGERQKIVLNFDKADIAEVTSQIFGDQLKLNYVVDQTLQGRMSMYIEGEFNSRELLQMVTRAYEANGVSVVPRKDMYFIQASQKAGSGLPIADASLLKAQKAGLRPLIVIYRLRYMDAKQASNLAAPFLSPGKKIVTEPLTNSLVFVEESENARSIVNLLKTIDINILQEVSMEIVPLHSISPQDAVQGMESLMSKLGGVKDSAIKNNLAFLPLQSFGGVLVMAQNTDLLKSARQWLQALDVQGVESGEQIYVYFIQNGLAHDIADILNSVYGLGGTGGTKRLEQQVVSSGRSSSRGGFGSGSGSSFGGSSSSSSSFGSRSSSGTSGTSSGSSTGSMFGSGTSGTSGSRGTSAGTSGTGVGTTRTQGQGQAQGQPRIFTGEVTVIADEVNNAIVTRANASDYSKIKKTIETLDLLPRAVLIEVMIAEITLTKDFQYGIQYWFQHNPSNPTGLGLSFGGLSNKLTTGTTSSTSTTTSTTVGFPNIGDIAGAGLGMSWIATAKDLAIFINYLSSKTNINILSNPTLLATDNKDATITVGGRQPVPTGSFTGGTSADTSTSTVFSTIQYEETGTILNVTPHINAGGLVRLEVEGIIRRVGADATVGANNKAPTFIERNIKTTLLAQSGNTVIIGGILNSNENSGKTGIPGLQDIPILKPLFSTNSRALDKTELIVAITPHVIDQRGSETSREFLEKMKNLRRRIEY